MDDSTITGNPDESVDADMASLGARAAELDVGDPGMHDDSELGRQRRQNVRVDVQLPIVLHIAGRDIPGRTRDVSATGIGFSSRLPIELEQRGDVTIEFSGWRFRKAFIVRFVKPILAGTQVGVQFDELTPDERERLVKQVFDVQRLQLKDQRTR